MEYSIFVLRLGRALARTPSKVRGKSCAGVMMFLCYGYEKARFLAEAGEVQAVFFASPK